MSFIRPEAQVPGAEQKSKVWDTTPFASTPRSLDLWLTRFDAYIVF